MTLEELQVIAGYLGEVPDFLVVDGRNAVAPVYLVAYRPWVQDGFKWREVLSGAPYDELYGRLSGLLADHAHVQALFVSTRPEHQVATDAWVELSKIFGGRVRQVVFEAGAFLARGIPLREMVKDRSGTTLVEMRCRDHVETGPTDLPVTVDVRASGQDRTRIFGVTAFSPYQGQFGTLPPPAWYRLPGLTAGTLSIDIEPHPHGDVWKPSLIGQNGRVVPIAEPRPTSRRDGPPDRLVVIFDRTCSDWEHWSAARRLVIKKEDDPPPGVGQLDFNRSIRAAVAEGLSACLKDGRTMLDVVWFADIMGPIGQFDDDHLEVSDRPTGFVSDIDPRDEPRLQAEFDRLTYFPGLDVWDPLESALETALRLLDRRRHERRGILIVGNSPPNFPTQAGSPLAEIARAMGFHTSYRRLNQDWHAQLELARQAQVPVIYLFLRLGEFAANERKDYLAFEHLQAIVSEALKQSLALPDVPRDRLISRNATREGVIDGISSALTILTDPEIEHSTVSVRP